MKFLFKNEELQSLLLRLLDTADIQYTVVDSQIEVTGRYEEAFDSLVDVVRDMHFNWWHCFKPLDSKKYSNYIKYMRANSIHYVEEVNNGVNWILTNDDSEHYDWGIENFVPYNKSLKSDAASGAA